MGAAHKYDLTSDVTHLIVGETDTPKYRFVAKERPDVKVLRPAWVEAVRESWLEGGLTDVQAIEQGYLLPTYYGLRICVTGFEDCECKHFAGSHKSLTMDAVTYRKQLEHEIQSHGGDYRGNLTKDVTHLVAKEPTGTKYAYAKQWGIKIVSVEWHEQSVERGMVLEETLYNPLLPPVERGKDAWIRRSVSATSLGKRGRESEGLSQKSRKLRRTASAKFEADNDGLWTNIVTDKVKSPEPSRDVWEDGVAVKWQPDPSETVQRSFLTSDQDSQDTLNERPKSLSVNPLTNQVRKPSGLFHGSHFVVHGFDERKTAILQGHLQSHGATVITDVLLFPPGNSFLLVPYTMQMSDIPNPPDSKHRSVVATDLWLERCIFGKRLEAPSASVTSLPFREFPLSGFENLTISSTGFQGVDLLHVSKVAKIMGASYSEEFKETSSVLICNNLSGKEKLWHAQLWKIPAVKAEWFWDCIRFSTMVPFDNYLVQPISHPTASASGETSQPLAAKPKRSSEDKSGLQKGPSAAASHQRQSSPKHSLRPQLRDGQNESSPMEKLHRTVECSFPDESGPIMKESEQVVNDEPLAEQPAEQFKKLPLQDISPNASPPKARVNAQPADSPQKVDGMATAAARQTQADYDESLGPAISSLLKHHQNQRMSNSASSPTKQRPLSSSSATSTTQDRLRPRRRQLLGRAPSNVSSSHEVSNQARHSITRASSIDTTNTDGLGTPIGDSATTASNTPTSKRGVFASIGAHDVGGKREDERTEDGADHDDDPDKPNMDHLQMTQLGYEDPDVAAWRERVAMKLAGGAAAAAAAGGDGMAMAMAAPPAPAGRGDATAAVGSKGTTPGRKRKDNNNTTNNNMQAGGLGIAKRTRLSTAGGGHR